MKLNPNAIIPSTEILKTSRSGIVKMLNRGTDGWGRSLSGKAKSKLRRIYNQLTFIIQAI